MAEEGSVEEIISKMDALFLIQWLVGALANRAWQSLGFLVDPATTELRVDLEDAQTAIDGVAALLPILEKKLEASQMSRLRGMLADLRVNYVQKKGATP